MQLSELFVSHKQVDPVKFEPIHHNFDNNIYSNLDRARVATSAETSSESSDSESSSTANTGTELNWHVGTTTPSPEVTTTSETSTPQSSTPTNNKRWVNPYKNNRSKWVADMTLAYRTLGLNDNAIKNLIAKNALESGWGNFAQGNYNFGNITTGSSWKGNFVQGKDHNASGQRITQQFRAYDTLKDFAKDEVQFLTTLYDFNPNDDFNTFINKLQGGNRGKRRYAEAPDYISKVRQVYNSI